MDLDESITVTALKIDGIRYNLLIGWQAKSFELYLYTKDKILVGRFLASRLAVFSNKIGLSESFYFNRVKRCLIEQRDNYDYELTDGVFYWKQKQQGGGVIIEGSVPVQPDTLPRSARPDLLEVLLAINKQLKYKINQVKTGFDLMKSDYETCLKDTEDFFNLKIDMEKALSEKYLKTLRVKEKEVVTLAFKEEKDDDHLVNIKLMSREAASAKSILSIFETINSASNKCYDDEFLQFEKQPSDYTHSKNLTMFVTLSKDKLRLSDN